MILPRALTLLCALALVALTTQVAQAAQQPTAATELCKLSISDLSDANIRGATVQIDGKIAGQAPITIELLPGEHLLMIHRPGFLMFKRMITLRVGHMQTLAPVLIRSKKGVPARGDEIKEGPAVLGSPARSKAEKSGLKPSGPPPASRQNTPNVAQQDAEPASKLASSAAPEKATARAASTTKAPTTTDKPKPQTATAPPQNELSQQREADDALLQEPEPHRNHQMQLSRGGRVLQQGALVLDVGVGYPNYVLAQGVAGLVQSQGLRLDAAIWVRSRLATTEGGLRMRMQLAGGGPFSVVGIGAIGGGGGIGGRDSLNASFGVGTAMIIAEKFSLGVRAMIDVWSDRLCPEPGTGDVGTGPDVCQDDGDGNGDVATAKRLHSETLSDRDTGIALTLTLTMEIALSDRTQLFFAADIAPGQAARAGYSGVFNGALIASEDPGYAGRAGVSFVF